MQLSKSSYAFKKDVYPFLFICHTSYALSLFVLFFSQVSLFQHVLAHEMNGIISVNQPFWDTPRPLFPRITLVTYLAYTMTGNGQPMETSVPYPSQTNLKIFADCGWMEGLVELGGRSEPRTWNPVKRLHRKCYLAAENEDRI